MEQTVLVGRGKEILRIPGDRWKKHLTETPGHSQSRLAFMTEEHHRVRYYIVEELPRAGVPISAQKISAALNLPFERVSHILRDLEENLFFLVNGPDNEVVWAFPVTLQETPHTITFSSGEKLYAA